MYDIESASGQNKDQKDRPRQKVNTHKVSTYLRKFSRARLQSKCTYDICSKSDLNSLYLNQYDHPPPSPLPNLHRLPSSRLKSEKGNSPPPPEPYSQEPDKQHGGLAPPTSRVCSCLFRSRTFWLHTQPSGYKLSAPLLHWPHVLSSLLREEGTGHVVSL